MSIQKANKFYQELTPQQKHFVDNKTINTTLSIKHWISFLGKTSAYDAYGDQARRTLNIYMGFLIAGIIVSVIVAFNIPNNYVFLVTAVLLGLLVMVINTKSHFVKRDINNYLRLFFMPYLEVMKQKAGEEAKLSASLDFRDPFKAIRPVTQRVLYNGRNRDIDVYEPKIIIAGVTLSDNSYLETVLVDEIKKIKYSSSSGKRKSKSKTSHQIFIRLSMDKKLYNRTAEGLAENVEFSENADNFVFKLKQKEKITSYDILKPVIFFTALGSLYNYVAPIGGQSASPASIVPPVQPLGTNLPVSSPTDRIYETLMWNDLIFDRHDIDGTRRRGSGMTSDDDSRNFFES